MPGAAPGQNCGVGALLRGFRFEPATLQLQENSFPVDMCHFAVLKMDQLSVLFSLPSLILVFNGLLLLLITFSYFLQQSIVCQLFIYTHFLDFLVAGETLLGLISVCDLLTIIKHL